MSGFMTKVNFSRLLSRKKWVLQVVKSHKLKLGNTS